jgi:ATP-dependent DNA ligase
MSDTEINRPQPWNRQPLVGDWLISLKIDGVRAIWHDAHGWLSRAKTPLYNIPPAQPGGPRDCEVFVGSFQDTIRAVRTRSAQGDTPVVLPQHIYGLEPLDPRLHWGTLSNPTPNEIIAQLQRANRRGHEGLVLRQGNEWIKVKPSETHDVAITGYAEGAGKHSGRLGVVTTSRGGVGAGFTDAERDMLWAEAKAGRLIGQVIEVGCTQLTRDGHFRHPVFMRMRPDKSAA